MRLLQEVGRGDLIWDHFSYEVYLDSTLNDVKVKTVLYLFGGAIIVDLFSSSFLIFYGLFIVFFSSFPYEIFMSH